MDALAGDADALAFARVVMSKRRWISNVQDSNIANKYASEAIAQVPERLRQVLLDETARLTEETIDYHPGSCGKVLNLVDPSFYPYVHGVSHVLRPYDPEVQRKIQSQVYVESVYQWLPTEFDVDDAGNVTPVSYINNLNESRYPDLFRALPQILSLFIPVFEKFLVDEVFNKPVHVRGRRIQVIVKLTNHQLQPGQNHEEVWHVEGMQHENIVASGIYYFDRSPHIRDSGMSFRRRRTHADFPCSYEKAHKLIEQEALKPYYDKVLNDAGLLDPSKEFELRTVLERGGTGFVVAVEPPPIIDMYRVQTPTGRLLAFSNNIQHKVASLCYDTGHQVSGPQADAAEEQPNNAMEADEEDKPHRTTYDPRTKLRFADIMPDLSDSGSASAITERKILTFLLIDPDSPILSTTHVPRQQWDGARVRWLFNKAVVAATGSPFPPELTAIILRLAKTGMTLAKAHEHRLALMHEREYYRNAHNRQYRRKLSLWER
ncbi:hypothetical protein RI367_003379 [Sorochytrium milnesiophthora]